MQNHLFRRVVLTFAIAGAAESIAVAQSTPSFASAFGSAYIAASVIDGAGNIYVTGTTNSPTVAVTPGAFQKTFVKSVCGYLAGPQGPPYLCSHSFVAKIDPTGSQLLYATYLGGSSDDGAGAIAVDADGNAYVAGSTGSKDFPITAGAYQTTPGPGFLTKLTPDGSAAIFSTYLSVQPAALALDSARNVFLTGSTLFGQLTPTPGAYQSPGLGNGDVFVLKLTASGSELMYASIFGGSLADAAAAIAVDSGDNAYVGGITSSTPGDSIFASGNYVLFPETPGAYVNHGGLGDVFITKLNPAGSALVYSSVFGGPVSGTIENLAVDPQGAAYFAASIPPEGGRGNFPTTPGALRTNGSGVVGKLSADGSQLVYSTYLGDPYFNPGPIRVDAGGHLFFSGTVRTPNNPVTANAERPCFPVTGSSSAGEPVAVFGELDSSGTSLLYSTYVDNGVSFDAAGHYYTPGANTIVDVHQISTAPASGPSCVVSAATHLQGPIAPGELISIFGWSIGPEVPASAQLDASGSIPSTLSGVSVFVGGIPAPVLYASKGQINAVVPFGAFSGQADIQVQGPSALPPLPVTIADAAPGIFYVDDLTQLAYSHAVNEDGTLNAWYNPARWGSIVTIYATGLGPMQPATPDGSVMVNPVSKPAYPVAVTGDVTYIGNAPGLVAGIVQINVRLPMQTAPAVWGVGVSVTTPSGAMASTGAPVYAY